MLEENHLIEEDILPLNKFASVMSRVHDNIGHVVDGYDEGDDFIDDSEVIQAQNSANLIYNVSNFKIKIVNELPPQPGLDSSGKAFKVLPNDTKQQLLNDIKVALKNVISSQFPQVKIGKAPVKYVSLTVELMEALIKYFKALYDNRLHQYKVKLSSTIMEKWRYELLKQIHSEIFVVEGIIFLQFRKLELAFKDFWRNNYSNNDDKKEAKDMPVMPN